MKHLTAKLTLAGALAIVLASSSCKKEFDERSPDLPQVTSAGTATLNHPGRTLAANCFQCHGTDGFAGELKIASMSASEILSKVNSYKTKPVNADIMYLHAQAYTTEEMNLIADYFSKQQ